MVEENKSTANSVVVVVLVVIALLAGVYFFVKLTAAPDSDTDKTTDPTVLPTPSTLLQSKSFVMTEQNSSGENGTVLLEEVGSQVRVSIALANPAAYVQPAHIHLGSCPTPGEVVYPLTDVVNGVSVTMIDGSLASLKAKGELAVNVHKSAVESSVYYSCGNLSL